MGLCVRDGSQNEESISALNHVQCVHKTGECKHPIVNVHMLHAHSGPETCPQPMSM